MSRCPIHCPSGDSGGVIAAVALVAVAGAAAVGAIELALEVALIVAAVVVALGAAAVPIVIRRQNAANPTFVGAMPVGHTARKARKAPARPAVPEYTVTVLPQPGTAPEPQKAIAPRHVICVEPDSVTEERVVARRRPS